MGLQMTFRTQNLDVIRMPASLLTSGYTMVHVYLFHFPLPNRAPTSLARIFGFRLHFMCRFALFPLLRGSGTIPPFAFHRDLPIPLRYIAFYYQIGIRSGPVIPIAFQGNVRHFEQPHRFTFVIYDSKVVPVMSVLFLTCFVTS